MKRLDAIMKVNPDFVPFSFGYSGSADENGVRLPKCGGRLRQSGLKLGLFTIKVVYKLDIYSRFKKPNDCEKYVVKREKSALDKGGIGLIKRLIGNII